MTGVLRIYDPAECDEHGVPLDWERCRCQREVPGGMGSLADALFQRNEVCPDCGGHGSLKAAALATRALEVVRAAEGHWERYTSEEIAERLRVIRCEGCFHPMSDGTWEGDRTCSPKVLYGKRMQGTRTVSDTAHFEIEGPGATDPKAWEPLHLEAGLSWLRAGEEPPDHATVATPWSPCDEGCRHAGPGRMDGPGGRDGKNVWMNFSDLDLTVAEWTQQALPTLRAGLAVEASWRAVDVRTMGWPHDLRPNKLATLCTRCWADRTRA